MTYTDHMARAISISLNQEPRFRNDPVDYMTCERAARAALDAVAVLDTPLGARQRTQTQRYISAIVVHPEAGTCPDCGGSGEMPVGVTHDFDTGAWEADDVVPCPRCHPEAGG